MILNENIFCYLFISAVWSLQFLRRHFRLLIVRHQQSGADGSDRNSGAVGEQHNRVPGADIRDPVVLLDRRHTDTDERGRYGSYHQLHIRARVLGLYVGLGHSRHHVAGERPDRRQRWRRQPVEDVQDHVGAHRPDQRGRHRHGARVHYDGDAFEGTFIIIPITKIFPLFVS